VNTDKFLKAINKASLSVFPPGGHRPHLGASMIGRRCPREVWYSFRWAYQVQHGGRLARLFNRGHEEEHRVVALLRAMDIDVWDYKERLLLNTEDPDEYVCVPWEQTDHGAWLEDVHDDPVHIRRATDSGMGPSQWGFNDGHFAGSADGVIQGVERWFPSCCDFGLLEIKTSNEKSFKTMVSKGVLSSKMEHYAQMQIYMGELELKWALYIVVNKNDDDIYVEVVRFKEEVYRFYKDRAKSIIESRNAPPRLSEDPSWFECRFCDFRETCHYGKEPQKNCRSCAYASAGEAGWRCNLYNGDIPSDFIPQGCDDWEAVG